MNHDLWQLYLTLQTKLAYGNTVGKSPPSEAQASVASAYITRMSTERTLDVSLIVGPGNETEVRALRAVLPGKLGVLTAHYDEVVHLQTFGFPETLISEGDIHDMPYATGRFAFLYASNVLEHCFAPYIALLECHRVLQENGLAYFVLPPFDGAEGGHGPFHLHCLTHEVWLELLHKTGYVVVDLLREPGGTDPTLEYLHYRCAVVPPPYPHHVLLRDLITYKATRQ